MSLPKPVVAASVKALATVGLNERRSWPAMRRILEAGLALPGAPRGTDTRSIELGGVPCEEVCGPGAVDRTRAMLFLHGGGYAVGSPGTHRALTATLAAAFGAPVIAVDYRLAPEHPHPAAIDDTRAVWDALVAGRPGAAGRDPERIAGAAGLAPERIAVAGDSAGCGLALALTLGLAHAGSPLPGALGLICPYVDPRVDIERRRPRSPGDVLLSPELMHRFATALLGSGATAIAALDSDPLLSPLAAELAGLPPMVVHTASEDTLRADGDALVAHARAAGVTVIHDQLDGYWHDPHLSARLLPEPARGAPARMGAALRALTLVPGRAEGAQHDT